MKLYIKNTDGKIYLRAAALSRRELAHKLGSQTIFVKGKQYSVNDVSAEKANDGAGLGMLVGGFIGALGGPGGILAGGAIGALLGKEQDNKDSTQVEMFNRSKA